MPFIHATLFDSPSRKVILQVNQAAILTHGPRDMLFLDGAMRLIFVREVVGKFQQRVICYPVVFGHDLPKPHMLRRRKITLRNHARLDLGREA